MSRPKLCPYDGSQDLGKSVGARPSSGDPLPSCIFDAPLLKVGLSQPHFVKRGFFPSRGAQSGAVSGPPHTLTPPHSRHR